MPQDDDADDAKNTTVAVAKGKAKAKGRKRKNDEVNETDDVEVEEGEQAKPVKKDKSGSAKKEKKEQKEQKEKKNKKEKKQKHEKKDKKDKTSNTGGYIQVYPVSPTGYNTKWIMTSPVSQVRIPSRVSRRMTHRRMSQADLPFTINEILYPKPEITWSVGPWIR